MTDLLLENARVVDGRGAPWFRGAIAISGGDITEVFRQSHPDIQAKTIMDIDEKVVCPGFIDTHSHSDIELFDEPSLAPKVRQGITTEVLGQDGFSMAPMYRKDGAQEWSKQLGALAGRSDIEWTWGGVGEYLDTVEDSGIAPNVALLVGHGTVRFNVLGMDDRDPNHGELEEMGDLVTEALEDGALGFSTGLIYTPCAYTGTHCPSRPVRTSVCCPRSERGTVDLGGA